MYLSFIEYRAVLESKVESQKSEVKSGKKTGVKLCAISSVYHVDI